MQLGIWLAIVLLVKFIVFTIQYLLFKQLGYLSYIVLYWMNSIPLLKLVFVMMIVPTFMNMLLFWIQDNFLKKKNYSGDDEEIEEMESI